MKTSPKKIMTNILSVATFVVLSMNANVATAQSEQKVQTLGSSVKMNVEEKNELRFKLSLENPSHQKLVVYLEDNNQNVLFSEHSVTNEKYKKNFDLSNLSDGKYTFIVEGGKDVISKSFELFTKTNRTAALVKNDK